jgi:uncharacterized membrane protein YphA (DoxX/SURF4 family)
MKSEGSNRIASLQVGLDNWFVRNLNGLKAVLRVTFGVMWLIDGLFKFNPQTADTVVQNINNAAQTQPSWLTPWFDFWSTTVSSNPSFFVLSTGVLELAIAFGLIFGFARKLTYTVSFFISLVIWSVPEGFGGPYGPGSTDIGTGIVYAIASLFLLLVNAAFGPSKYSIDGWIERRWTSWKRIAEIRSG